MAASSQALKNWLRRRLPARKPAAAAGAKLSASNLHKRRKFANQIAQDVTSKKRMLAELARELKASRLPSASAMAANLDMTRAAGNAVLGAVRDAGTVRNDRAYRAALNAKTNWDARVKSIVHACSAPQCTRRRQQAANAGPGGCAGQLEVVEHQLQMEHARASALQGELRQCQLHQKQLAEQHALMLHMLHTAHNNGNN